MARKLFQDALDHLAATLSSVRRGGSSGGEGPVTKGYDAGKAAQFSAYLLLKTADGMEKLKLSKLLYVAERNCAAEWGHPLFFDDHFSVKDGPICTNALNGIDGLKDAEIWAPLITLSGNRVRAGAGVEVGALDRLSEADIAIADGIWKTFEKMTAGQVRNWTHDPRNVPEYREPVATAGTEHLKGEARQKRIPITARDMAVGLGMEDPDDYAEGVEEIRRMRASNPFD